MLTQERIDCAVLDLRNECNNNMIELGCGEKEQCEKCYIPTALEALEMQIPVKAKPILSREERDFCEVIGDGYIARDEDERLWVHAFEPTKNVNKKEWESRYHYFELICSRFSFIRWEDAEPWDVQDLLKLEVEE